MLSKIGIEDLKVFMRKYAPSFIEENPVGITIRFSAVQHPGRAYTIAGELQEYLQERGVEANATPEIRGVYVPALNVSSRN